MPPVCTLLSGIFLFVAQNNKFRKTYIEQGGGYDRSGEFRGEGYGTDAASFPSVLDEEVLIRPLLELGIVLWVMLKHIHTCELEMNTTPLKGKV